MDLSKRRCSSCVAIVSIGTTCPDCIAKQRAVAVAKAGPSTHDNECVSAWMPTTPGEPFLGVDQMRASYTTTTRTVPESSHEAFPVGARATIDDRGLTVEDPATLNSDTAARTRDAEFVAALKADMQPEAPVHRREYLGQWRDVDPEKESRHVAVRAVRTSVGTYAATLPAKADAYRLELTASRDRAFRNALLYGAGIVEIAETHAGRMAQIEAWLAPGLEDDGTPSARLISRALARELLEAPTPDQDVWLRVWPVSEAGCIVPYVSRRDRMQVHVEWREEGYPILHSDPPGLRDGIRAALARGCCWCIRQRPLDSAAPCPCASPTTSRCVVGGEGRRPTRGC